MTGKRIPPWVTGALAFGAFLALSWLERRRPLRPHAETKLRREARNLAVAGVGALVVQGLEAPLTWNLTSIVEERRWGLLKGWPIPWWAEVALGVLLIDYSMYLWHVANHRVELLWRTHVPHHADLDLDASTALRFHFTELMTSLPLRAVQIVAIGAGPLAFSVWQTLFLLSILFHHSKVRLPAELERRLVRYIVTPRMHGVHHSIVREEDNSNFSSGLTIWDRLHGTLRLNVPQAEITIGVPAYREQEQVTLPKVLAMPFGAVPDWRLPDGSEPVRVTADQRLTTFQA